MPQILRNLLCSYLVFFTDILPAYEPQMSVLSSHTSLKGHWIRFTHTTTVYACGSHVAKCFHFSVQKKDQETTHDCLCESVCLCLMADVDYPLQGWKIQIFFNSCAPHIPSTEALKVMKGHLFNCKVTNLGSDCDISVEHHWLVYLSQPVSRHGQAVLGRIATKGSDSVASALTVTSEQGSKKQRSAWSQLHPSGSGLILSQWFQTVAAIHNAFVLQLNKRIVKIFTSCVIFFKDRQPDCMHPSILLPLFAILLELFTQDARRLCICIYCPQSVLNSCRHSSYPYFFLFYEPLILATNSLCTFPSLSHYLTQYCTLYLYTSTFTDTVLDTLTISSLLMSCPCSQNFGPCGCSLYVDMKTLHVDIMLVARENK